MMDLETNVTAFPAAVAEVDTEMAVDACRAEMDISGLSTTQASREIGVSSTTLSK